MVSKYDQLLDTFLASLEDHEGYKKDTILQLAHALEADSKIPLEEIAERIIKDLEEAIKKGYITKRYIHMVLPAEYKRPYEKIPKRRMLTDGTLEKAEEERESDLFHDELKDVLDKKNEKLDYYQMFVESQKIIEEKNRVIEERSQPFEFESKVPIDDGRWINVAVYVNPKTKTGKVSYFKK